MSHVCEKSNLNLWKEWISLETKKLSEVAETFSDDCKIIY